MSRPLTSLLLVFLLPLLFPAIQTAQAQGSIELSETSLYDFREVYTGNFSDVQFYDVSAQNIGDELEITAENPFRVSINCYDGFGASITLPTSNGDLAETRIFVRFFPEQTGEKTGDIIHESGEAEPKTVSVSGTGIENAIPDGYYATATGGGSLLKTRLFEIIRNHNVQSYASLWDHFTVTDATFSGKVWDMYSDTPCEEPPYIYTFYEDQDTGTGGNEEGDVYNREHSMPRSWFGGAVNPMNTDLYHIFPVDKHVNAVRANFPFGMVDNPEWTSMNGGKLGPNATGSFTGTAFEPIDDYKGDLARAFFYMITRYENLIEDWTYSEEGNSMFDHSTYPGYEPWALEMLMEWHENDPVSQKEILRNDVVYAIQGNRNPFVDHPEFVERIWGDTTLSTGHLPSFERMHLYPNPANDHFYFEGKNEVKDLELFSICGKKVWHAQPGLTADRIELPALQQGIYLLVFHTVSGITTREKLLVSPNP